LVVNIGVAWCQQVLSLMDPLLLATPFCFPQQIAGVDTMEDANADNQGTIVQIESSAPYR
jgi:hypothetical protein